MSFQMNGCYIITKWSKSNLDKYLHNCSVCVGYINGDGLMHGSGSLWPVAAVFSSPAAHTQATVGES